METATDTSATKGKGSKREKPVGRQDSQGQEAAMRPDVLKSRLAELVKLHGAAAEAAADLNDAIKACAEKSGYLASVIRKRVVAEAGENFADKKREVTQLALAFEIE